MHEALNGGAAAGGGCSAKRCGADAGELSGLSEAVRARVQDHPCYSEQAHHHFARMHAAVAPACNIQCHYCNRKYDCANESRPGVVSEVLTPEQAVAKTLAVAAAIPQLSVLGIAGPGDPLANPERTFATFRLLSEKAPDLKLCVSTNGLALPEHIDELARHNIGHVTITINCIDPDIGAQIYPWIFWKNRRVRGRAAAAILIEQQQKGLEMLVARGILVKVNSVMIPGVNDQHLKVVSRTVREKGAFLHNVMPLIAAPEHGTFFGLMGQRGPEAEELGALQDECAGDMKMMRHCRQCRADAVGMLGEDRSAEFTLDRIEGVEVDAAAALERREAYRAGVAAERARQVEAAARPASQVIRLHRPAKPEGGRKVRMAVASRSGVVVDEHFGHAREFRIYDVDELGARLVETRAVDLYCSGSEDCGEAESVFARTLYCLADCAAVLCARIGLEPWKKLEAAGIVPDSEHAMEAIDAALPALRQKLLAAGKLESVSDSASRERCA